MKCLQTLRSRPSSMGGIVTAILFFCFAPMLNEVTAQEALDAAADGVPSQQGFEDTRAGALLQEARQLGSVKIIVQVETAFQPEGLFASIQSAISQRHAIAAVQDRLFAILSGHRVSGVKRFKYTPHIAMTVDEVGLRALLSDVGVGRIHRDELLSPTLAQSVPLIHADAIWADGFTGMGWAVAILDTGVDTQHVFLDQGKVVSEACFSTTDQWLSIESLCPNGQSSQVGPGAGVSCPANVDGCFHGTHVASIAAGNAAGTRRTDLSGVANDASLIAIQVFSRVNNPDICSATGKPTPCALSFKSDVVRGLERVFELRHAFNIAAVNMSLGGGKFHRPCDAQSLFTSAIQNLRSVNIASVVASGNEGFSDGFGEPACVSSAISVGNTQKNDTVNTSSNSASFLSLLAPGTRIVSAVPGNQIYPLDGTSMAAPHIAGAFALLRQAKASASVNDIVAALQRTGVPITDPRNNITTPRIDVKAALEALTSSSGGPTIVSPTPGTRLPGAEVTFQWTAHGESILEWWLYIGNSQGAGDVYNSGSLGNQLSTTIHGLPTDGRLLFVRLWFRLAQGWQATDLHYFAASSHSGMIPQGTFRGAATTTIAVLHPGTGGLLDHQVFVKNVEVITGAPAAAGGLVESNPLNLAIYPLPVSTIGEEGQLSVASAFPFRFADGPQLLAQYWTLAVTGQSLTGTLTDSHAQEAIALNLINSLDLNLALVGIRFVTTLPMDVQITRLTGTIDANQARLTIEGNTTDCAHPFVSQIAANRVN